MLVLLCRWKDIELAEWEQTCSVLKNICSEMGTELLSFLHNEDAAESDTTVNGLDSVRPLRKILANAPVLESQQIEQLQLENDWLQQRLDEKSKEASSQIHLIEELRQDLLERSQQMEIKEDHILCCERKIRDLEEQLAACSS